MSVIHHLKKPSVELIIKRPELPASEGFRPSPAWANHSTISTTCKPLAYKFLIVYINLDTSPQLSPLLLHPTVCYVAASISSFLPVSYRSVRTCSGNEISSSTHRQVPKVAAFCSKALGGYVRSQSCREPGQHF